MGAQAHERIRVPEDGRRQPVTSAGEAQRVIFAPGAIFAGQRIWEFHRIKSFQRVMKNGRFSETGLSYVNRNGGG